MQATMTFVLVISFFIVAIVATSAAPILATEEKPVTPRRNGGNHERRRRNHRKRHSHPNVANHLDPTGPMSETTVKIKHHGNHAPPLKNRTKEFISSTRVNEPMHQRNHTHQITSRTDDTELKMKNITLPEKNEMKIEKKSKAQKSEMTHGVNTTTLLPLDAEKPTDIHAHHKHEGKDNHDKSVKKDVASPSNDTSVVAPDVTTKTPASSSVTESEASSFAAKEIKPSSSTRTVGKGVDPKKPWKEDNELEDVLTTVQAEFEANKQSAVMEQKLINSATSFTIRVFCLVGLVVQTFVHPLIF